MGFGESLRLALEGLRANKMRAALTMLGIIIGIAAVIAILTVGDGLTGIITDTMSEFGASSIGISLQERMDDLEDMRVSMMGMGATPEEEDLMTEEMLEEMVKRFGHDIDTVSLTETVGSGQAKDGRLYANLSLTGVNPGYFEANETELLTGRFFRDQDMEGQRMICLVSHKLVNNLFEGDRQAALGQEITVELTTGTYRFRIIGVYEHENNMMNMSFASEKDVSTAVYIPLKTAKHLSGAPDGFSSITVVARSDADGSQVARELQDFLNRYYKRNEDYRVSALSMDSMIETVDDMLGTLSIAISVIAAISLLVGGIGVMNIMLVSVTERTREIGTRKALGATNGDIRIQFVVESAVICLVGGVIGILLGAAMGYVGSYLLDAPALPSFGAIALAVGFSLAVGIFFGYYPANKAAKMDPIEALRYE